MLSLSLTGFDVLVSSITVSRNTQAIIGDADKCVTVTGLNGGHSGMVKVFAENCDGVDGGIAGEITSYLVGVHDNIISYYRPNKGPVVKRHSEC